MRGPSRADEKVKLFAVARLAGPLIPVRDELVNPVDADIKSLAIDRPRSATQRQRQALRGGIVVAIGWVTGGTAATRVVPNTDRFLPLRERGKLPAKFLRDDPRLGKRHAHNR